MNVYKNLRNNTLEFGNEGEGVGEARCKEGEVCRALKFRSPQFETSIQISFRGPTLLHLLIPLKITPYIQKHGQSGGRDNSDTEAI